MYLLSIYLFTVKGYNKKIDLYALVSVIIRLESECRRIIQDATYTR